LYVYIASVALLALWFVLKFAFGKGGFIHFLIISAFAVALVQFMQERRAARR
jgi:hypothetical protein